MVKCHQLWNLGYEDPPFDLFFNFSLNFKLFENKKLKKK